MLTQTIIGVYKGCEQDFAQRRRKCIQVYFFKLCIPSSARLTTKNITVLQNNKTKTTMQLSVMCAYTHKTMKKKKRKKRNKTQNTEKE